MHYMLNNAIFKAFYQVISRIKYTHKKEQHKLRMFLEAVYYMVRTGCQWRMLPWHYGSWRAIHKRLKKWSDKGYWKTIFEALQIDPDMEYVMIDSTIVRANACAAGYEKNSQDKQALGRSKG